MFGFVRTHGTREFATFEGKEYTRRVGTADWEMTESLPPSGPPLMELKIVRENQIENERYHWSLFLSGEGQPGDVYQVKGDAVMMYHSHEIGVDVTSFESFKDSYIIAQPTEQQIVRIRYWASHEVPPSAPNQAAVTENCQSWVIRVVQRLVDEGIVEETWINTAKSLKQPVR